MTGSLQIKKGYYYVALNTYLVENGEKKRKPTWIPTNLPAKGNKRKAEQMLLNLLSEYESKSQAVDVMLIKAEMKKSDILFTDYMLQWLEDKKSKIELNSWESYETYVKKHIITYFEKLNLKIGEVTPKHIKEYYNFKFSGGRRDKKTGGLSVASIKKHSTMINQAFDEALIDELIERNPVDKVRLPKKQEKEYQERVFLTAEEAKEVLHLFKGHQLYPVLLVTLYYGLRRSEAVGLKWSAVDFRKNTLSIQHTVVQNKTRLAKDKTKNFSSRGTFALLPEVRESLLEVKKQSEKNAKLFGKEYYKSDYVFVWPDGKPFLPDYCWRAFKRRMRQNGMKDMRFHDLRHSTASILYDKGWNIKDIQEWLRHADIGVTGNIYTHITKSRKQILAQDMENTLRL